MKVRNNISQRTAALARKAAATLLLAATLGMTACQEEIPIQRPGDDDGDAQQPATVSINVGTKPAIEGITLYGVETSTTSAATRTNAGGRWEVGDQITVSIRYFSDEEGEDAIGTATQTLTYAASAGSGEGNRSASDARSWQADPAQLPLPAGVHSLRIGYHYASFDPAQTAITRPVITVGRERMVGHLATTTSSLPSGVASITGPTEVEANDCTSLVVLSDPTAAIHLPAPVWYRQTAMVQLSSVQPGQQVALQVETQKFDPANGGSLIGYTTTETLIATNSTTEVATANIHFTPVPPTYDENDAVVTQGSYFSLYDPALGGGTDSPTPLNYVHIDFKPSHIYSFFASALYEGSGGDDAQVVDGTDANACAALLTADNPQWVVTGGGDGNTPGDAANDKTVLTNVRTALDAMKADDGEVPDEAKGTIDLVLTGVKSLPKNDNQGAFTKCTQLRSVSAPEATGSIEEATFIECKSLTTVSLPKATGIGNDAFNNCISLTTVSLPEATGIGNGAFVECKSLTTVSLPKVTGSIGESAFLYCTALTTVSLPAATSIGNSAFESCIALTSVSLPEVTTIESNTFYGCTALTTVSLPKATEIKSNASSQIGAFSGCTALTELRLTAAGSITINGNAFNGTTGGTTVNTKNCTLYLNPDKASDADGDVTPKVAIDDDGKQTWANLEWKEIKFVDTPASVSATGE